MSQYKTAEFKKLQKEWYQKAEANSEFKDIEEFDSPQEKLKSWALDFKRLSPEVYIARMLYFQKATAILDTYDFENEVHKEIWRLHSLGFEPHEIVPTINKKGYGRNKVFMILRTIKKEIV